MLGELKALLTSDISIVKSIQKIRDRSGKAKGLSFVLSSTALAACGGATAPRVVPTQPQTSDPTPTPTPTPTPVSGDSIPDTPTPITSGFTQSGNSYTGTDNAETLSEAASTSGLTVKGLGGNDTINTGSGNDYIRPGLGVDSVNAGAGDDVIVVIGTTTAGEYASSDITNPGGSGLDLSSLINLSDLNGQAVSEGAAGEIIDGGSGNNTLVIYGTVDLSGVTLLNITTMQLNSTVTLSPAQLAEFTTINGDGTSTINIVDDPDDDVVYEIDLSAIDMSNVSAINITGDVLVRIESADDLAGIESITGDGNLTLVVADDGTGTNSVTVSDIAATISGVETVEIEDTVTLVIDDNTSIATLGVDKIEGEGEVEVDSTSADATTLQGVEVDDTVSLEDETGSTINAADLGANTAPVLTAASTASVVENTMAVMSVSATDIDTGDTKTYSLSGEDADLFAIDGNGVITFDAASDYETPGDTGADNTYNLTVIVTDAGGITDTQDVVVTVTNVNEAPVLTAAPAASVDENTTAVMSVSSNDMDDGDTKTYSLTGNDAALFSIDGDGVVTFDAAPDYETPGDTGADNTYDFNVVITDAAGLTDSQAVAVTVDNVNEAPILSLTKSEYIVENSTAFATFGTVDVDQGDAITYSISGDDASLMTIDNDGVVTFKQAPDHESPIDYDGNGFYSFTITATDSSGLTDSLSYYTPIGDENEAPTLTIDSSANIVENTALVLTFTAYDEDYDQYGLNRKVPIATLSGADADLFEFGPYNTIYFKTAPDYESPLDAGGDNTYEFTITLTDDGGLADMQAVTVNVENEVEAGEGNTAPVLTAASTANVAENTTAVMTVSATDVDTGDTKTYSLTGDDANLFTIDSDGVVMFKSAPDYEYPQDTGGHNYYNFTIVVTDGAGLTDEQGISITVTDANEAPVLTASSKIIDENTTDVLQVDAWDVDNGEVLTYSLTGADAAFFAIDSDGNITFKTAPDYETPLDAGGDNIYNFDVTVTDSGGLSATGSTVVTVENVDESGEVNVAPILTAASAVDVDENTTAVVSASAIDANTDDSMTYSLTGDDADLFSIDTDGVVMFKNAPDFEYPLDNYQNNTYVFTIVVTDAAGLTDEQGIVVSVVDANEAPVLTASSKIIDENTTDVLTVNVSDDADGLNALIFTVTGDDAAFFAIDADGNVSFKIAPDYENPQDTGGDNVYDFDISATDSEGLTSTESVSITVKNVYEAGDANIAPVLTANLTAFVLEGDTEVMSVTSSDADNWDSTSYSLTGDDAALFDINSDGDITFKTAPDYTSPNDVGADNIYNITVVVTDTGSATDTQDIVVTVSQRSSLTGIVINGISERDASGISVSNAGDVNGDGIDDFIIGASGVDGGGVYLSGASYIIFGSSGGFNSTINLATLDGTDGFVINGARPYDGNGVSVSYAGDVNGDGIDDIIIGSSIGGAPGYSHVFFGSDQGFSAEIDLLSLDGTDGFIIAGLYGNDRNGHSVSNAGDINGDGIDDLIIGAYHGDPSISSANRWAGESYIVFGNASGFDARLDLENLDGNNGFTIQGTNEGDYLGMSVSAAGDVNGDGIDDIIVGASSADPNGIVSAGTAYVIYGASSGFSATFDLTNLDGTNGYSIDGLNRLDQIGKSVANAGDVNGDGIDDILLVSLGETEVKSYVIFGTTTNFGASLDLSSLNGTNGFVISGDGGMVSSAGDINGDGIDDIIIGSGNLYFTNLETTSNSYIIFGSSSGFAANIDVSSLDGSNGFVIQGITPESVQGVEVSSAGDVNGDGVDDLIISFSEAAPNGATNAGQSYVVFGHTGSWEASYDLVDMVGEVSSTTNLYAPVINANSSITIFENTTSVMSVSSTDADVNDTKTYSISGADSALFNLGKNGLITFKSTPNYEDPQDSDNDNIYTFNITVTDSGGLSDTQGVEVTVADVSDVLVGMSINGILAGDASGFSVSNAGDVNGDGIDDVIIGAAGANPNGLDGAGESYVVFGTSNGFPLSIDLSSLDGTNGFVLQGIREDNLNGWSVSTAGDINNDGIDDIIIGARETLNGPDQTGMAFIIFGSDQPFSSSIDLTSLDGNNGFTINGVSDYDYLGGAVSDLGDVNGDGIDDIIIGATYVDLNGNSQVGQSYVIFGSNSNFSSSFDLTTLDGNNGFAINGIDHYDQAGVVSSAGDINGDGINDILIGASRANPNGNSDKGESYVVFGTASGFAATIELSALDGTNGFKINGFADSDYSGSTVAGIGDINGDGFDDIAVAAPSADPNENASAGEVYVLYGKGTSFGSSIELFSLDGSNGFIIRGLEPIDKLGASISTAGDINGDGIDDFIIGAPNATNYPLYTGDTYVIFGNLSGFGTEFDLTTLDGTNGFIVSNKNTADTIGSSVSIAGDVNGDGIDDIIIGAPNADPNNNLSSGETYIIYGHKGDWDASYDLADMIAETVVTGTSGNDTLSGTSADERFESLAGDDTITTGSGADVLMFDDGFGNDTVTDFENGSDLLNFATNSTITDINDLTITVSGSDTIIDDGNGNTITLTGITSGIDENDFIFGA